MFSFLSLVEIGSVFVSSHYHVQQWRKIGVWPISLSFNGFIIEIFFFCCKLLYVLYERCLIPFYQANERHMRTLAVEPPPLLDKEERRVKFINRNGLCCTLYKVDTQYTCTSFYFRQSVIRPWRCRSSVTVFTISVAEIGLLIYYLCNSIRTEWGEVQFHISPILILSVR